MGLLRGFRLDLVGTLREHSRTAFSTLPSCNRQVTITVRKSIPTETLRMGESSHERPAWHSSRAESLGNKEMSMPSISATASVSAPASEVYRYLRDRYGRELHRTVSLETKGYIPAVKCVEELEPRRIIFQVRGRDPVLRFFIGGWTWCYDIEPDGETMSRVTIRYEWGWLMSILGAGTTRHQAANEIVETALALEALGWHRD